jgi:hypothetical protein
MTHTHQDASYFSTKLLKLTILCKTMGSLMFSIFGIYTHLDTIKGMSNWNTKLVFHHINIVVTSLWGKCEVATHTPENGTRESSRTPENSKHDCRGQNTLHWGVLYTVEKVLKCRCPKWPHMSHLDICSITYGWKKGRESNWQFDSQSLKVGNRLDPGVCRWSATHCWKALKESYKFVPIKGQSEKLWTPKVPGVQTGTISGLHFGSPKTKSHLSMGAVE